MPGTFCPLLTRFSHKGSPTKPSSGRTSPTSSGASCRPRRSGSLSWRLLCVAICSFPISQLLIERLSGHAGRVVACQPGTGQARRRRPLQVRRRQDRHGRGASFPSSSLSPSYPLSHASLPPQIRISSLLVNRSPQHLTALSQAYKAAHKHTLPELIRAEFSGDLEDSLLFIAEGAEGGGPYGVERDAEMLERAMKGFGTKDERL